jgi:hypothetical protein
MQGKMEKLIELKQICKHAEPNYGVLWFFYKSSVFENAIEVWDRAQARMTKEMNVGGEEWIGSRELIFMLRNGLRNASFE